MDPGAVLRRRSFFADPVQSGCSIQRSSANA
jgi:hypothetical protein